MGSYTNDSYGVDLFGHPTDHRPENKLSFGAKVILLGGVAIALTMAIMGFAPKDFHGPVRLPHMVIYGYTPNLEENSFTVYGASSLPAGALVSVEMYPVKHGLYAEQKDNVFRFMIEVQQDGMFTVNTPTVEAETVFMRVAFSPSWQTNARAKSFFDTGEFKFEGPFVISENESKQLYAEELLFFEPIF
jgi:hypothetical protein